MFTEDACLLFHLSSLVAELAVLAVFVPKSSAPASDHEADGLHLSRIPNTWLTS